MARRDFYFVQWGDPSSLGDTRVRTVNGVLACESKNKRVHLGKGTVSNFPIVSCQNATVKPQDSQRIGPYQPRGVLCHPQAPKDVAT